MAKLPVFIGGAWPSANGSLHLGHIAGLLPGDVLARYYRLQGNPVLYVSGSDCHGTPITIRAEQEGVAPADVAARYHAEFAQNLQELGFTFDLFWHTTHPRHHGAVQEVFRRLRAGGWLYERSELQAYCRAEARFLPDRYVEGLCGRCRSAGARGDQCDACGALLTPADLLEPHCRICGAGAELRQGAQLYFRLSAWENALRDLLAAGAAQRWRENAVQLTRRYLDEGLRDRAATRDMSWGIPVPFADMPEKKVYVWFDALLGYYTASREWAVRQGDPEAWRPFWDEKALAFYVHGKDNIPFHTLILPGLLLALGDVGQRPAGIVSSEYLTLYGRKISTSRNYAIWLPDYLRRHQADALRYYFLSNGPEGRDADFSWDEFARRTNDELLGAWGNLLHRLFTLAWRHCAGQIPPVYMDDAVIQAENQAWQETFATVGALIEQAELKAAIQTAFSRIRATNRLVDQLAPWRLLAADPAAGARALATCVRYAVNAALLLLPFIPGAAQAALTNVGLTAASWRFHELPSGLSMAAEPVAPIRRVTPSEVDGERQLLLEQAAPER